VIAGLESSFSTARHDKKRNGVATCATPFRVTRELSLATIRF
jgi:hypothetical protein